MNEPEAEAEGNDDAAGGTPASDLTAETADVHDPSTRNPPEKPRQGRRVSPQTAAILQRVDRLFWQHSLRRMRRNEKEGKPK